MLQSSKKSRSAAKPQAPAENNGEKNTPKWTRGKSRGRQNKEKQGKINTAQGTVFLRRRQVAEQQQQKAEGTYVAPEKPIDLKIFDDFPVMSLEELEEEDRVVLSGLEQMNMERMQNPANDENLSTEFWALEGMLQDRFHHSLPRTHRSTVPSLHMGCQP